MSTVARFMTQIKGAETMNELRRITSKIAELYNDPLVSEQSADRVLNACVKREYQLAMK